MKRALEKDYIKQLCIDCILINNRDVPKHIKELVEFVIKKVSFKEFYTTENTDYLRVWIFLLKVLHRHEYKINENQLKILKQHLISKFHEEYNFDEINENLEFIELKEFITEIFKEGIENKQNYNYTDSILRLENELKFLKSKYFINKIKSLDDFITDSEIPYISEEIDKIINEINETHISEDEDSLLLDPESDFKEIDEELFRNLEGEKRLINLLKEFDIIETRRVCLVMSPTGHGKSQFLCHVAADYLQNAELNKEKYDCNLIFYFSFENTKAETLLRILANITDYRINDIKEAIKKDKNKFYEILNIYKEKVKSYNKLEIIEIPSKAFGGITVNIVEDRIKKTLKKYPNANIYAVIVDYLDLMTPINKTQGKQYEQLSEIAKELKYFAMQLKTAVISATQTNREGEQEAIKKGEIKRTQVGDSYGKIREVDVLLGLIVKPIPLDSIEYEYIDRVGKIYILKHRYGSDNQHIAIYADYRRAKFYKIDDDSFKNVNYLFEEKQKREIHFTSTNEKNEEIQQEETDFEFEEEIDLV